jgi:hypothetical protein
MEYRQLIAENWGWIKTRHVRKTIVSTFNLRLPPAAFTVSGVADFLRAADALQDSAYKIQIVFGYVYRVMRPYADPTEAEEFSEPSYFRPQKPTVTNTGYIPDGPWTVAKSEHLEDLILRLDTDDIVEHLNLRRPTTKHLVELVSNVMLYVYRLAHPIIGSCCSARPLPRYLTQKTCVTTLWHRYSGRGQRYRAWPDQKCGFRCLAASELLSMGLTRLSPRKVTAGTETLFRRYCARNRLDPATFDGGLTLDQVAGLEELVDDTGIFVYELVSRKLSGSKIDSPDRRSNEILRVGITPVATPRNRVAVLRRKPSKTFSDAIFLDLCGRHFSLITDIERYCSAFLCGEPGCSLLFDDRANCIRHERICGKRRKRKMTCTGGGYDPFKGLFDRLDSVGVSAPESLRYQDLFCTFDCEAYSQKIPHESQLHGVGTL